MKTPGCCCSLRHGEAPHARAAAGAGLGHRAAAVRDGEQVGDAARAGAAEEAVGEREARRRRVVEVGVALVVDARRAVVARGRRGAARRAAEDVLLARRDDLK